MRHRIFIVLILVFSSITPIESAVAAACAVTNSSFIGDGSNSTVAGKSYTVATISDTNSCNFSIPAQARNLDILTVGGGGGGGGGAGYFAAGNGGGGGGGAGAIEVTYDVAIGGINSLTIQVGAGGANGSGGASGAEGTNGSNGSSTTITELGISTNGGGGAGRGVSGYGGAGGTSGSGKLGGSGKATTPWTGGSGGSSTLNGSNASTSPVTGTSIYFSNLVTADSFSFGGGGSYCGGWGTKSTTYGSGGYGGRASQYNGCGSANSTYSYGYNATPGNQGVVIIRYWLENLGGGSYCPPPTIESVSPEFASSNGGDLVTISGDYLSENVLLDDIKVDIYSATTEKIIFKTPKSTKGTHALNFSNKCNKTTSSSFIVDPDPILTDYTTSKIPTSGDFFTAGGKFLASSTVMLDDYKVEVLFNSDSFIKLRLPPMTEGTKSLIFITKFGTSKVKVTYLAPPQIFPDLPENYLSQGDSVDFQLKTINAKRFELIGNLPTGLELNSMNGRITGVARQQGIYTFSVKVVNEVGSDSKNFVIDIDKPAPRAMNVNLYYAFRSTEFTALSSERLNHLIAKIKSVQPRHLGASIIISSGDGYSKLELARARNEAIGAYLHSSGINIASINYVSGNAFRAGVTLSWNR